MKASTNFLAVDLGTARGRMWLVSEKMSNLFRDCPMQNCRDEGRIFSGYIFHANKPD